MVSLRPISPHTFSLSLELFLFEERGLTENLISIMSDFQNEFRKRKLKNDNSWFENVTDVYFFLARLAAAILSKRFFGIVRVAYERILTGFARTNFSGSAKEGANGGCMVLLDMSLSGIDSKSPVNNSAG